LRKNAGKIGDEKMINWFDLPIVIQAHIEKRVKQNPIQCKRNDCAYFGIGQTKEFSFKCFDCLHNPNSNENDALDHYEEKEI
jgi:hypothetical protein